MGTQPADLDERLRSAILELLGSRKASSTICPSDAARAVGGTTWRAAMPLAREIAAELADDGVVEVRQHGQPVDVRTAEGPVRIARGARFRD